MEVWKIRLISNFLTSSNRIEKRRTRYDIPDGTCGIMRCFSNHPRSCGILNQNSEKLSILRSKNHRKSSNRTLYERIGEGYQLRHSRLMVGRREQKACNARIVLIKLPFLFKTLNFKI